MKIPFFYPYSSDKLIQEVQEVIVSGYWTGGVKVSEAEYLLMEKFNFPNFVATSSATSAFEVILDTFFTNESVNIVVPTNTFATTAEVPKRLGHRVIFCDVDPISGMIDTKHLSKILESHEVNAVIPVSIGGALYDRENLIKLKKEYGFKIIEDLAQLIYPNCFHSAIDASFFSFYPNKIISSPDGGGMIFSDETMISLAKERRLHGIRKFSDGSYDIVELGRKANMTNISAAFIIDQLNNFDEKVDRRTSLYKKYESLLSENINLVPTYNANIPSLLIIHSERRNELKTFLKEHGVETSIHFRPLHLHSHWNNGDTFKGAEEYFRTSLSLPFFECLKDDEIEYICGLIDQFHSN
ncbi:DegT/DnrJ/EryC1/StrS family aminotransferase [Halobacteriovorax sp. DPLXC-1]|uniref:DegT/DnrJ/EryC1/StrS family aminotransferase n=1 Tax=Halobacteriovorax sp. DPLXC-1 TaxID=3110771 RepID=UPI002FF2B113